MEESYAANKLKELGVQRQGVTPLREASYAAAIVLENNEELTYHKHALTWEIINREMHYEHLWNEMSISLDEISIYKKRLAVVEEEMKKRGFDATREADNPVPTT